MVTQEDIARVVGYSQSLVSMVLANDLRGKTIRPSTRQKILDAAAELGYRPNRTAMAFISGRHQALGVLLRRVGGPGSALIESLIQGITDEADRHDQRLWLRLYTGHDDLRELLADVDSTVVDGLIFDGQPTAESTAELLQLSRADLPVVRLRDNGKEPDLIGISERERDVCRIGTEHLIERGCRRIVHFRQRPYRAAGYLDAVRARGLPELCRETADMSYRGAELATEALLDESFEFDGISAQSDQQAFAALNVPAHRAGPPGSPVLGVAAALPVLTA